MDQNSSLMILKQVKKMMILMLVFIFTACSVYKTRNEVIEFIETNSDLKKQGDNIIVTYWPHCMLNLESGTARTNKFFAYFIVELDTQALLQSNPFLYGKMNEILNARVKKLFTLNVQNKNYEVSSSIFTPQYGLSQYDKLFLVFNIENAVSGKNMELSFNGSYLGQKDTGFLFPVKQIKKIEKITREIQ